MAGLKKRYGQQRGAAALETVLLTPAALLLLYTIAQYCLIFVATQIFTYTAEEALRRSISFVDSNCYYGGECSTLDLEDEIERNGDLVIRIIAGDSPTLFGKSLSNIELFDIEASTYETPSSEDDVCCKVTVTYQYSQAPFLPSKIFGVELPVPDTLTGTAMLTM
ncbi:TadE/TadG family type IV pilus assembly protein [Photobacterium atrarenae]|uniref:Pilus assembly protein n=1 Tax=Photobacterium atrarenae TaxID=865757 RepID=A0ABY5GII2_9GAMM|nr:TadE/TadG family type IV pilus assembly protein [Photobacterium atrarenae]UTV28600.1 pilus assembly protein [Photobacterium atrarenae]